MPKTIPAIQITNADKSERNTRGTSRIHSNAISNNQRTEYSSAQGESFSDAEYSSDEDNFSSHQSTEYYQSDISFGESAERISNIHSPAKTQRSIVYCKKSPVSNKADGYTTDYEGISASDDEFEDSTSVIKCAPMKPVQASNENTSIRESVITKQWRSPAITPDLTEKRKDSLPILPRYQNLTDSEFIFSDSDNSLKAMKIARQGFIDGFVSDAEDSDSSMNDNPFFLPRKNSLQVCKNTVSPIKITRKTSVPIFHELNVPGNIHSKEKQKSIKTKCSRLIKQQPRKPDISNYKVEPDSRSQLLKLKGDQNCVLTDVEDFEGEYVENDVEEIPVAYVPETKREIILANENLKGAVSLILPIKSQSELKRSMGMDTQNYGYSDVEDLPDFGEEEEVRMCITPEPPLLEGSFIKASELYKEKSKLQLLKDSHEPLTDTEDLHFSKETKVKRLKSKENLYLKVNKQYEDPLTDTEDILINTRTRNKNSSKQDSNKLAVGNQYKDPLSDTEDIYCGNQNEQKACKSNYLNVVDGDINESLTDVEDLAIGEDQAHQAGNHTLLQDNTLTDLEEFSGDDIEDDINSTKLFREYAVISSCNSITAKESHSPFSNETKAKLSSSYLLPEMNIICPSPVPCPTDQEDMSGEEEGACALPPPLLDDCNVEPHASTVHIRHTRIFQPKREELKTHFLPDPLTDVEELDSHHDQRN